MNCRLCHNSQLYTFCDLGQMPLANSYLNPNQDLLDEPSYPLHARVCSRCLLVQVDEFEKPEAIFSNYLYFSSFSETWIRHVREYADRMTGHLKLNRASCVVEIASNDGCLLEQFSEKGISVLGIEPAKNVAKYARKRGIPTQIDFFGSAVAGKLKRKADLVVANNVLAHVPDLNDFIEGIKILLAPMGVATLEFPHLLSLIRQSQYDTIYHEHFSYFSLHTVREAFVRHALDVFDAEEISIHGGSLRIYVRHAKNGSECSSPSIERIQIEEESQGLLSLETYLNFGQRMESRKKKLVELLAGLKRQGASIAAYGAPAKGNTLLNFCGIGKSLIEFTVDRSPHKQGHLLPGSHIPILSPEAIKERKPDYILILPWNIKKEIIEQVSITEWGGRWIVPIPEPCILP